MRDLLVSLHKHISSYIPYIESDEFKLFMQNSNLSISLDMEKLTEQAESILEALNELILQLDPDDVPLNLNQLAKTDSIDDALKALDLTWPVSKRQVEQAYKVKALVLHPDRNSDSKATEQFQLIAKAKELLVNYIEESSQEQSVPTPLQLEDTQKIDIKAGLDNLKAKIESTDFKLGKGIGHIFSIGGVQITISNDDSSKTTYRKTVPHTVAEIWTVINNNTLNDQSKFGTINELLNNVDTHSKLRPGLINNFYEYAKAILIGTPLTADVESKTSMSCI